MKHSVILPAPGKVLRALITATGFRPCLEGKGLDRDLDHLALEARPGSNFELLETCQAQWLRAIRDDAGAAWSNWAEAAWTRYSGLLRSLARNFDTTGLLQGPAHSAIMKWLVIPEIAAALKRATLELPLFEISTWWASPFAAWLSAAQQHTALEEKTLLARLANHADLDERTLARWQRGGPIGTGLWPYRNTLEALLFDCKLPSANQERLIGWLIIAAAVQSCPAGFRSSLEKAFRALPQQPLKTEAQFISSVKREAADRESLAVRDRVAPVLEELHHLFADTAHNQQPIRDRLGWLRTLCERGTPAVRAAHEYLWLGYSARLAANLEDSATALKLYAATCDHAWWRAGPNQHAFIHEALCYAVGVGNQVHANHYWDRCFWLGLNTPPKRPLGEQTLRRVSFGFERLFAPQQAKARIPPALRHIVGPFVLRAEDLAAPNALRKHAEGRVRYTPFMNAVLLGELADVKALAEAGGDPNAFIPESGETALIIALRRAWDRQNPDILQYLLTLPITPETANRPASTKGETPLHIAMNMAAPQVVEQLIERGADVEQPCYTSPSALVYAMALLHDSLLPGDATQWNAYLQGRVPADAFDAKSGAILDCELAAHRQNTQTKLANPRHTLIFEAVSRYYQRSAHARRQVVLALLAKGADANRRYADFNGHRDRWTPTLFAAQTGDLLVFKAMLEAGGNPWALLDEGEPANERNALWVAVIYQRQAVAEYLLERLGERA
ncbi:ankyrin repeat domain-containing protein [Pseudomonas sp. NPDC007930]|uniref:ankyrin repeat domain-containing protein n=1 Tax=Pseudomonas sp. NPDC007930 TaxID=3364417 RepID=UPI0036E147C3